MRSRRVGPATFRRLIAAHDGSAEAALEDLPRIAAEAGLDDYAPCAAARARAELDEGYRLGARPLFLDHPAFPAALAAADDAPPMLWVRGEVALLSRPAIGLVGARNASSLGRRMARLLASGIGAAGYVTVSGLARGIDAEVHAASLETGTIAVLAGGVDVVYPEENARLTAEIAERGALVSEMPPGLRPQARHFPRRNRIVAGLGAALVVVEAAAKSGSLITARDAADLGREVLAVPGHPFDGRAAGCNGLLRDGATLVRGPQDVLAALRAGTVAHDAAAAGVPVGQAPPSAEPEGRSARRRMRPLDRAANAPRPEAPSPGRKQGSVEQERHARRIPPIPRSATTGIGSSGAPPRPAPVAGADGPAQPPAPPGAGRPLDPRPPQAGRAEPPGCGEGRARILALLGPTPAEEDAVWRDTGLARAAFAALLTELELDGAIRRAPGGLLSRSG